MKRNRGWLTALLIALFLASASAQHQTVRLELIPPSPVTDKVILDIRGAVENDGDSERQYAISLYLDRETPAALLHTENKKKVPAHGNIGIYYRHSTEQ